MVQVIDASIAVAWCARSQATPLSAAVLAAVVETGGHVPSQFWFEVLHDLARIVRRGDLHHENVEEFSRLLADLPIEIADPYGAEDMIRLHRLAGKYALNIYDISYVDLALSKGIQLATKDEAMASAMAKAGGYLFEP